MNYNRSTTKREDKKVRESLQGSDHKEDEVHDILSHGLDTEEEFEEEGEDDTISIPCFRTADNTEPKLSDTVESEWDSKFQYTIQPQDNNFIDQTDP